MWENEIDKNVHCAKFFLFWSLDIEYCNLFVIWCLRFGI